ncbi:hypothetical protein NL676_024328 [Syzygium grande]|nr:hypothetical protein NL676_024328 [Syzygium grande]
MSAASRIKIVATITKISSSYANLINGIHSQSLHPIVEKPTEVLQHTQSQSLLSMADQRPDMLNELGQASTDVVPQGEIFGEDDGHDEDNGHDGDEGSELLKEEEQDIGVRWGKARRGDKRGASSAGDGVGGVEAELHGRMPRPSSMGSPSPGLVGILR